MSFPSGSGEACSNKMRGQRARRAGHVRNADGADAPEPPSRASAHWQPPVGRRVAVAVAGPPEPYSYPLTSTRCEPL